MSALKEVITMMDYDSVDMILTQLDDYSLPEADSELFRQLRELLKKFDWDSMEKLIMKGES